jgi:hypothetical protein
MITFIHKTWLMLPVLVQLSSDQNKDATTELVFLVLLNVLLVPVLLITVQFVLPEESTHQFVDVQTDNTPTMPTSVETVTLNV